MPEPAPQPQKKSKSTPILIIIGGIIAALLVVVIILLFSILNKTPAENDTAQSSAQPSSSQSSSSSSSKPSSEPKLSKEEELAIALQEFKNAKTFEFELTVIGNHLTKKYTQEERAHYKVDYNTGIIDTTATYHRLDNDAQETNIRNFFSKDDTYYFLYPNCDEWAVITYKWKDSEVNLPMKFFRTLFSLSPKDATNKGDYFHFPNSDRGIDRY